MSCFEILRGIGYILIMYDALFEHGRVFVPPQSRHTSSQLRIGHGSSRGGLFAPLPSSAGPLAVRATVCCIPEEPAGTDDASIIVPNRRSVPCTFALTCPPSSLGLCELLA